MTRLLPLLALLPLAACGHPDRAPTLGGNLTDDTRGAHAGSFRAPGSGDGNLSTGNTQ